MDNKVVAAALTEAIKEATPKIVEEANKPQPVTEADVEAAANKMLTQDPPLMSKRVWAGVFGVLTAILSSPEVQTALMGLIGSVVPPMYLPIATAMITAGLATLSKKNDTRPIRNAP